MKIMVCGSREMDNAIKEYALAVVRRAKATSDAFIVGDAAGVNETVIQACDQLGVAVTVYGAFCKMRHSTQTGTNIAKNLTYSDLDRFMVEQANLVIGIWNGRSKGTMAALEYAHSTGKRNFKWFNGALR